MRTRYETQDDLDRERLVMTAVGKAWGVEFTKLPDRYRMDYVLTVGNIGVGFAEIKCRTHTSTSYDTWFISSEKLLTAQSWEALGLPCTAIVQFADGIFTVPLKDPDYYAPGGRSDRADGDDQEVMAHFKSARLTRFRGDSKVTRTLVAIPVDRKWWEVQ